MSAHSPTADKANSARAIEKMPRHAYREIRYSSHKCPRFRFVIRSADKMAVRSTVYATRFFLSVHVGLIKTTVKVVPR